MLEVLKIASLLFCLWLFSLIYDNHVFTRKQMMLKVIKLLGEKLNDRNVYLL